MLLRLGWNFGAIEHDKGEVFGIDVTHLFEMVEQCSDVGLGPPDKGHTVAEHFVRKIEHFLSKNTLTKDSIEVVFQSTLTNMPWTLVAHFSGSAVRILGSETSL